MRRTKKIKDILLQDENMLIFTFSIFIWFNVFFCAFVCSLYSGQYTLLAVESKKVQTKIRRAVERRLSTGDDCYLHSKLTTVYFNYTDHYIREPKLITLYISQTDPSLHQQKLTSKLVNWSQFTSARLITVYRNYLRQPRWSILSSNSSDHRLLLSN